MSLVGLDLSATRLRAAGGNGRQTPARLALERDSPELPAALSLEGRAAEPGSAGVRLARLRPHSACLDFLPHLGGGRVWAGPRLKVGAADALSLVLSTALRAMGRPAVVAICVPAYLDDAQVTEVRRVAEAAKLPVQLTVPAGLAGALARPNLDAGPALVIDADGHAVTWSLVGVGGGRCAVHTVHTSTGLGRAVWMRRLVDGTANRFIRQSRHDPRDSAATEQALYEQLLTLTAGPTPPLVPLALQGDGWSHHLLMPADDLIGFVGPCLRLAAQELDAVMTEALRHGGVGSAVLTASAAALPGLSDLVRSRIRPRAADEDGDYGDAIVQTLGGEAVHELGPDALSVAAYELAARVHAGHVPSGHLTEAEVTASAAPPADAGPPRLQFRGEDHVLSKTSFVLGRDPGCDLVFESELYPHVSARHCEIVLDRRAYLLYDRSRHGTMLNDKPVDKQAALHSGDWIRLGPRGPVVRFLGTAHRG